MIIFNQARGLDLGEYYKPLNVRNSLSASTNMEPEIRNALTERPKGNDFKRRENSSKSNTPKAMNWNCT
jgi:hypothetical protein